MKIGEKFDVESTVGSWREAVETRDVQPPGMHALLATGHSTTSIDNDTLPYPNKLTRAAGARYVRTYLLSCVK
jgi:hypothetical protein